MELVCTCTEARVPRPQYNHKMQNKHTELPPPRTPARPPAHPSARPPCRDATIMGSRNGHAPIYMWYTLTRKGYEGMRKDVERCLRNAHFLKVGGVGGGRCGGGGGGEREGVNFP